MSKSLKIEKRTEDFILGYNYLKQKGIVEGNAELAEKIGIKTISSISEIKGRRQNIQPENWEKFKEVYAEHLDFSDKSEIKEVKKLRAELNALKRLFTKFQSQQTNLPETEFISAFADELFEQTLKLKAKQGE